jgi:2-desacetyl-2-hydroxyethyl bacteriochlorophyllide A dehydrogenase
MKAVALSPSRDPELVDRPDPRPAADEVVIRIHYCGICGSDLHAKENQLYRPGVVLGHEFAGEILKAGPEVRGWKVGQLVSVNPNGNVCHRCAACRSGRANLCRVATLERPAGVVRDGGMAELVALHTSYLQPLPDGLDTRRAAWAEPLAVAVRAVRTSPAKVGDRVAVIGGGPVGQLVLQVLRRAGMGQVAMVEPSTFRRQTATRLGADQALAPDEARKALAGGELAPLDHVFECSGHPTTVQLGIDLLTPGGSLRLVGVSPRPVSFDPVTAIIKEVSILTGFIYVEEEFAQAVLLLASSAVDVDTLTTAVVPLEQFADAFAALRQPQSTVKVLIGPKQSTGGSEATTTG